MREIAVWVVITDGLSARICSNGDGVAILFPRDAASDCLADEWDTETRFRHAYAGWHAAGAGRHIASAKRRFVEELAAFLRDGARERAYDNVVLIAAPQIADDLHEVLAPETRALLVGGILRDGNGGNAPRSAFCCN